jgi:transcriptional regulator with XRE-family HTH domain
MTRQGGWPPTGFGGRLKRLREERALTQQDLAERSGCHAMTITKLERGVQEPAWPLVLALAKALGVTCEAFNGVAAEQRPPGQPSAREVRDASKSEGAPTTKRGRPRKGPGEPLAEPRKGRKGSRGRAAREKASRRGSDTNTQQDTQETQR